MSRISSSSIFVFFFYVTALIAQSPNFSYFYDDAGQLIKVIDSAGNEVDYLYDSVGNIIQVTRNQAPAANALAILSFTPQSGSVGTQVTIQGQNFSATPASNQVTFNGVAAALISATATSLVVMVPTAATTGAISVTVGANNASSDNKLHGCPCPCSVGN